MAEFVVSPFPDHAAPRVWMWLSELRGTVMDDFGPQDLDEFIQVWTGSKARCHYLDVSKDSQTVAMVCFTPWNMYCGAMQLVVPPYMFYTEGVVGAVRAAVEHIFGLGYGKVLSFPMVQATSIIRLLKAVPFRREGTLRQQTFRFGKPADVAVFGVTPEILRGGEEDGVSSLSASNFGFPGGGPGGQGAETEQPVLQ